MPEKKEILRVQDLRKYYPIRQGVMGRVSGHVKAVDGLSFSVREGETFALVGESGCGKSTAGRAILRLSSLSGGEVWFQGEAVHLLGKRLLRALRPSMQMIFQDPYSALNPRKTVGAALVDILRVNGVKSRQEAVDRSREVLALCGLQDYHFNRYPHEFSGGQRQRVVIARALALNPRLVVADEPLSALDVSIQSQIINLLEELQDRLGLTYLFISHDLGVVRHMADHVGVMYLGKLVERAPKDMLFGRPLHPYTRALLDAVPSDDPTTRKKRVLLQGELPSPANPPAGCPFHTRCPQVHDRCRVEVPALVKVDGDHAVACHLHG